VSGARTAEREAAVEQALVAIRAFDDDAADAAPDAEEGVELELSEDPLEDELLLAGTRPEPPEDPRREDPSLEGVLLARRITYSDFPELTKAVQFPHARSHPAHRDRSAGEIVAAIRASVAWQEEVAAPLADRDAQRRLTPDGRQRPGPAPKFTFEETEVMELYRRVVGVTSTADAFHHLARFEAARDRELLGFHRQRFRPRRGQPWRHRQPGIPSESTMSKYRLELGEEFRERLWAALLLRLRREYVALSDSDDSRVLFMDGTNIKIQGIAPIVNSNGELRNDPAQITVPDAGFAKRFRVNKGGHGFNAVILTDSFGVPLADDLDRIQRDERKLAVGVLADWNENIRPAYPRDEVRVIAADSGFGGVAVRAACRKAGMIETIHPVSHGSKSTSRRRAKTYNRKRLAIEHKPEWALNYHRELVPLCGCGRASQERQAWLDRHGVAHTRLKGRCEQCGSNVTLKSGRWRRNTDSDDPKVIKRTFLDPEDRTDYLTGNPLTFNDPSAKAYGLARFVRNEGLNGMLASHYKLNGKPRRFRSRRQVRTEMNIVFSVLVSLAIQARAAAADQGAVSTAASASRA
jgi:hypothetical protein